MFSSSILQKKSLNSAAGKMKFRLVRPIAIKSAIKADTETSKKREWKKREPTAMRKGQYSSDSIIERFRSAERRGVRAYLRRIRY